MTGRRPSNPLTVGEFLLLTVIGLTVAIIVAVAGAEWLLQHGLRQLVIAAIIILVGVGAYLVIDIRRIDTGRRQ